MPTLPLIVVILGLGAVAFLVGRHRARTLVAGKARDLHSRPTYYGALVMIWTALPALLLALVWAAAEPGVTARMVHARLPADVQARPAPEQALVASSIGSLASGLKVLTPAEVEKAKTGGDGLVDLLAGKGIAIAAEPEPYMLAAAERQNAIEAASRIVITVLALATAGLGLLVSLARVRPAQRARDAVERVVLGGLIAASLVAILTTVGIVLSMLFQTIRFFQLASASDFFFGTVWDPRFAAAGSSGQPGQFGLLPLLWGTLYISFVALLVAVPVGLMAAIYMAEYAGTKVRGYVKPLLELLAGIPTIVYGLFAVISLGPFLRDLGAHLGMSVSATSVLTAGLVMGIMLIPFVSSLSDDVIAAVPQSLRDGSYGLGATQSETIKRVVLPAALPGIVGAVLLAASRAIGETMIVVLAAGIAANLTLNPLQPVTTMTVKIVSQLTGDLEFNSPQTLVAFALGLTLFVMTLGLNVCALAVVRRYRERYQ
mgnify:CR=1 FL=1